MADRDDRSTARNLIDEETRSSQGELRGVLAIGPFRNLWMALAASSLGNWLGLLALTALAASIAAEGGGDFAAVNYAIGGVLLLKLLPALVLGPFAGLVADRFNRRWTMVVGDLIRAGLTLSIPFVREMWWVMVATVLIECASLFWMPAKEATIPNLVPRERLEAANQLNLLGTYGTAPIASALFAILSLLSTAIDNLLPWDVDALTVALCVNAATFFVSAMSIARIRGIPGHPERAEETERLGIWRTLIEGWKYVGKNKMIRGLVIGVIGAFAAGGVVIGLAKTYVTSLGAGNAGYGVLVGCVFTGLALGMLVAPRLLSGFSRRRLFAMAIIGVGAVLLSIALIQNIVIVSLLAVVVGGFAGMAWVTGYTLLGLEVADEVRGRTFAFVQNAVQLTLIGVLAAGPFIAGSIGTYTISLGDSASLILSGAAGAILIAGVLALIVGFVTYRTLDDRRGISLWKDLGSTMRGEGPYDPGLNRGLLIAFEGGEGAGKSTQARLLAEWLTAQGRDVVLTREPGATPIGSTLRTLLLDHRDEAPSARAEALLYAADRAQHVDTVIRPALERGTEVITDRFLDSSVAYQAAGRKLVADEIARLSLWATRGLRPNLTILLDLPPIAGLERVADHDRLESEPLEFHERVRSGFHAQARRLPERYLVLDARRPVDEIQSAVRERVGALLAERDAARQALAASLVDTGPVQLNGAPTPNGSGPPEAEAISLEAAAGDDRTVSAAANPRDEGGSA